jgi:hypothetical protein
LVATKLVLLDRWVKSGEGSTLIPENSLTETLTCKFIKCSLTETLTLLYILSMPLSTIKSMNIGYQSSLHPHPYVCAHLALC